MSSKYLSYTYWNTPFFKEFVRNSSQMKNSVLTNQIIEKINKLKKMSIFQKSKCLLKLKFWLHKVKDPNFVFVLQKLE